MHNHSVSAATNFITNSGWFKTQVMLSMEEPS